MPRKHSARTRWPERWPEILFVFASVLCAAGLLIAGSTSEGSMHWSCMILLAIVVLSEYFENIWEHGASGASTGLEVVA